ncbi:hypothetical protein [Pantoea sp. Taur]|uniref:hypothetical protein n=1 Tax=Pantoea sp. Taur TaxID=2576757 RepID=UPI0013543676|nr:hypothetical protein [Pantoea sp. Taur]MXP59216.1 hypothetical protein [Pantoea sp. Taur]
MSNKLKPVLTNKKNKLPLAVILIKDRENFPKKFMLKYFTVIITYIILCILFSVLEIENNSSYTPYLLLTLPLPAIYFSWNYIACKEKKQRDIIKSVNDSLLYVISGIVALFAVIKTVPHSKIDAFTFLLENGITYIALSFYSIFLFIKAFIAIAESKENINSYIK